MRFRVGLGVLIVAAVSLGIGRTTADSRTKLNPKTEANLSTAMHGEAFAFAKYMLYAQRARANQHPEVAELFESAARTERYQLGTGRRRTDSKKSVTTRWDTGMRSRLRWPSWKARPEEASS